jgi:hypothetical protein
VDWPGSQVVPASFAAFADFDVFFEFFSPVCQYNVKDIKTVLHD